MSDDGSPDSSPSADFQISAVRHYLAIVRRRWVPALFCFTAVVAMAIAYSSSQKAAFQGTAQVLLGRQNLANALTNTPDPTSQANDFIRIVQTQADVARSPEVAVRAIARAKAPLTPKGFLASSSVEPQRDADLLTFHAVRPTKAEALRLTNAYARAFIDYRLSIDTSPLRKAQQEVASRLTALRQQGDTTSSLVRSLASKEQELGTLETLQTSNAILVRGADAAEQVAPRLKRNLAIGIIGGLLLAIAAVAIREMFDKRVRDEREVEDRLDLRSLAQIGPPPRWLRDELLLMSHPHAREAEPFRLLRTNLQFAAVGGNLRSLLVTSCVQGEGKSTTLSNLAVTLARGGQKVVLLELDLRRPTLRRLFRLPPGPGLTDVLLGRLELEDALRDVPIHADGPDAPPAVGDLSGSLVLLTAGTVPPNPGELVTSELIHNILDELIARSDIVLIDSPPALLFGDALTLSRIVDAVFLCVRLPLVTRPMLDGLARALSVARVRALGSVITGEIGQEGAGYGYGYGYDYGRPDEGERPAEDDLAAAPSNGAAKAVDTDPQESRLTRFRQRSR